MQKGGPNFDPMN